MLFEHSKLGVRLYQINTRIAITERVYKLSRKYLMPLGIYACKEHNDLTRTIEMILIQDGCAGNHGRQSRKGKEAERENTAN